MFSVLRGVLVYFFLLVIFRISGKRTISQITTFDFVLLLIISEVVQQAMIANDNSMINAALLVITLVGLGYRRLFVEAAFGNIFEMDRQRPIGADRNGRLLKDRMERERVDEGQILERARELQGLERLDQIKYAVLESSGGITIVPKEQAKRG